METDGVNGCITLVRLFRALNYILKIDKVTDFVVSIFTTIN